MSRDASARVRSPAASECQVPEVDDVADRSGQHLSPAAAGRPAGGEDVCCLGRPAGLPGHRGLAERRSRFGPCVCGDKPVAMQSVQGRRHE